MHEKAPSVVMDDLLAALGLLTRLPVAARPLRAAGAWAFPLAGLPVGGLAALSGALALAAGVPVGIAAAIALAAQMISTGALHEDGLADTCDGFWGGWDRPRRLEIMKDSRIGTYGVLALAVVTLARWSALSVLIDAGAVLAPLLAAAVVSRAPMVVLMSVMENARGAGLSNSVGRPGVASVVLACLIALTMLIIAGAPVIAPLLAVALVTVVIAVLAKVKIGGQTGDVLGAAQQLSELAVLTCFAILVT